MKLIKFYADWCKPCTYYNPIVDEVAEELDITLLSVNIDSLDEVTIPTKAEEPLTGQNILTTYKVGSIPTLVLISDEGEHVSTLVGSTNKSDLTKWISDNS